MGKFGSERSIGTDVLVIGGGFGGLYAAIKAKEEGARDVLIVDKGTAAMSSMSRMSAGSTVFVHPGDDVDEWHHAVFRGQRGLCNQDMAHELLVESTDRLRELESWGVAYRRDPHTGGYLRLPSRGLAPAMMTRRPTYKGLTGGAALTTVLRKRAVSLRVRFLNKTFISGLAVRDGRVLGAVGIDRRSGAIRQIAARAVIVAAADCGFHGAYAGVKAVTGDSFALAWRAGCDLVNMEFIACNTGPIDFGFEGTGPAARLGARFLNARGEAFMPQYHPEGDTAEITYLVQAMADQVRRGNAPPFYLDFSGTDPAAVRANYMEMGGFMPLNLRRMGERGIDVLASRIPWAPAIQTHRGGIKTDAACMSSVEGLFAAGTAQSLGPGLFNGWSSARCLWSGTTAGRHAARYAAQADERTLKASDLEPLLPPLDRSRIGDGGALGVNEALAPLQRALVHYETTILKSAASLARAQRAVAETRALLCEARQPDLHEFIKAREAENTCAAADLFLAASMLREESRFDHKREDFPQQEDAKWLRWIVLNRGLAAGHRFEDLPWNRYRLKPSDLWERGASDA